MKITIVLVLMLTFILATLFYLGGYVLLAGLGAIALTSLLILAFAIGSSWTRKLINDGARIAIEATSRNDQHDAQKITALAGLTREAIKAKMDSLNGYPALPDIVDGSFTITGLESEDNG
jgi:hypothetical protein